MYPGCTLDVPSVHSIHESVNIHARIITPVIHNLAKDS